MPAVSLETQEAMKKQEIDEMLLTGFYPIDPPGCVCKEAIFEMQEKFSKMNEKERRATKSNMRVLHCPANKNDYTFYGVFCSNCKDVVATLYAKHKEIGTDWLDLHHHSRALKKTYKATRPKTVVKKGELVFVKETFQDEKYFWSGCAIVNVNPDTKELSFECHCGTDTRNPASKGRQFGKKDSKFIVKEVSRKEVGHLL